VADGGEGVWEAKARKDEWAWVICPPMPLVGVLRLVMVCGGKRAWDMVGGGDQVGVAGAVKNEWVQGICLMMPVVDVLCLLMVWGGNGWQGVCLRCGKGGGMSCGRSGHWD
jgi:hypothetical protein